MSIEIRDFIKEDSCAYVEFSKQFYSSLAVNHKVDQRNFQNTFEAILGKSPFMRGVMLLYNGERAGYGLASFTYSNEAGGMVLLLEEIFVLDKFQGKGILRECFEFLEKEYKGKIARFRLEVTRGNKKAIDIYSRYGFTPLEYVQMVKEPYKKTL